MILKMMLGMLYKFGVYLDVGGVNFVVFFDNVIKIEFCLFLCDDYEEIVCYVLLECIGLIWYGYFVGFLVGVFYGYCVYGFYVLEYGYCFNFNKLLLDFYICEFDGVWVNV